MHTILLVEDNPVEQKYLCRLLADLPGAMVCVGNNGVKALESLNAHSVDLVLTDLNLPEMDGLQLLQNIRESFPDIPVVLMTGEGSERLAMEALRLGAANYLRKEDFRRELIDICRKVLELSSRRKEQAAILKSTVRGEIDFVIDNDTRRASQLARYLQESAARIGEFNASKRTQLGVALEEALINAVVHGNLEVSSALRERDDNAFAKLIAERQRQPHFASRRVSVRFRWATNLVEFTIRDQGPGFDVDKLPDPTDPENLFKASGRGILLMRSFMDEVHYNATGNQVRMLKYFSQQISGTGTIATSREVSQSLV